MDIKRTNNEMAKEIAKRLDITLEEAWEGYLFERKELRKAIKAFMDWDVRHESTTEELIKGTDLSAEMKFRAERAAIYKEVVKLRKKELKKEEKDILKAAKKVIRKFHRM